MSGGMNFLTLGRSIRISLERDVWIVVATEHVTGDPIGDSADTRPAL